MKFSNILIALPIVLAVACSQKSAENNHGHEHEAETKKHPHQESSNEHGHEHEGDSEEHVHEGEDYAKQEEFTLKGDSAKVKQNTEQHSHEDGSTHPKH